MTDDPTAMPKTVDYRSNSKASSPPAPSDRPAIQQVVPSGGAVEKKKGVGTKFREQFAGDDAKTVLVMVLIDVVVPAIKNLAYDVVVDGARRALFGGSSRPSGGSLISSIAGGTRTDYRSYSAKPAGAPSGSVVPQMTQQQRATFDFTSVFVQTREQGMLVIDTLSSYIEEYGSVTVNEFYSAVGISTDFTNVRYGWKSLAQASVKHVREGYYIDMPKPILLE